MKKSLIVLSISLLLIGCSSTPQEQRLEQYIEQTNTDKKERSIDWYYKNDYERNDVLNICYAIYLESAEKAGYYSQDISQGKEKYLDPETQKEMYLTNEECGKAYKAQELLDKYITDKSLPQELVEDMASLPEQNVSPYAELNEELVLPTDLKELPAQSQAFQKPPTLEELTQE